MNAPGIDEIYKLKSIVWTAPETNVKNTLKIVTQNKNGPCPLIAIANTLVLQGKIQIPGTSILAGDLIKILGNFLESKKQDDSSETTVQDIEYTISQLPDLLTGLNVNVQFDSIRGVATTSSPATRIFKTFGVDLVHGWVVDPIDQSELFELLVNECRNSYEGAVDYVFKADSASGGLVLTQTHQHLDSDSTVEKAVRVNTFLSKSSTMITPYGLSLLGDLLPDNHLCVIFRNNHFCTMYRKHRGELFLLANDEGLAQDENVCWETLVDVQQMGSSFVDCNFRSLEQGSDFANTGGGMVERTLVDDQGKVDDSTDGDYALALQLQEKEDIVAARTGSNGRFREALYETESNQRGSKKGQFGAPGDSLYGVPYVSGINGNGSNRAINSAAAQSGQLNRQLYSNAVNNSIGADESYLDSRYEPSNMDYLDASNKKNNFKQTPTNGFKKESSSSCIIS
ncbi:Protein FAM63A [Smittium mucronatum]|uniref:Protein FAM63A n=1 Tax=Smittium mucronatum TaxID=133383 RepID=A0A1R0GUL9_9FUNG|nr:Protein FAM63A [Smittium mucronatum]